MVADAAGNHTDLIRTNENRTEFGTDVEDTMLEDNEEVAVCTIEGRVCIHRFTGCEDEDPKTRLHGRISSAGDQVEGMHPVRGLIEVKGIPAELVGNLVEFVVFWIGVVSRSLLRGEW